MTTSIAPAHPILHWWRNHVVATVDHSVVVQKVDSDNGFNGRYVFMTLMSAGIAVLGLLLSSPAVIIGAMLISPLMGPIIGLGFGVALFDAVEIRRALTALALGTILAILFCAMVVLVSPLQTVTSELAARTRPNLFDLLVALFSGLAGAYAMIRGREGAIVGVAIATALMPPLATVGFGLATWNGTVFFGSLLLFFTNFMVIALSAAIMARLYGFGPRLSPRQTVLQTLLMLSVFIALAVPLGFTLRQIAWEATASRQARDVVSAQFGDSARVSQIDVDYAARPLRVTATVLTPQFVAQAERAAAAELTKAFGRPVGVAIEQFRVEVGNAEAAQLARAQANERATLEARIVTQVAEQLALVAGVPAEQVLVDRDHRRAQVTATPLPGADLAAYRTLEARVAAVADGWSVELIPPAVPLPSVSVGEDGPDAEGQAALRTAIWAARRLRLPLGVSGAQAEAVAAALADAGIAAERLPGEGAEVELEWLAPGQPSEAQLATQG
ncbi:DUF389 domain-containing protein [Sphingomonas japonica]|uniref:Hydrophobic protein (TIGR00271 family) n=1 Tax=Sphingomonas japonica TaxID=511662 RepID=A0ABX0U217_9SPHN|nr:DUF389 domain-containing protein [Sphingomonas japonica]NIJ24608.1 putative hydrophobic protein (TIGR00271 family) [Sphingomonas japonica]